MRMAVFMYILVVLGIITTASGHRCCLPGQVLISDNQCKDVETLETSPLSLACFYRSRVDRSRTDFFVNDQGVLEIPLPNRVITHNDFCEDELVRGSRSKHVALICTEPPPMIADAVTGYCMVVSAVFLILTASRYALRGFHRDLFGKSVINLCTSLGCGMFVLALMKLVSYTDMSWCTVRGFSAYFFVLVSFFWMNAIALQTLNSMRPSESPDHLKAVEKKWYRLCVIYAWGVPTALTGLTALINFLPGDHLKPGIGLNHCWFFTVSQQWEYMYSVMSVLTAVNIIVFSVITSTVCWSSAQSQGELRQKFVRCVQLFIVMGIPWVFEMTSSLVSRNLAWEVIDLFNALQGLWIFIVLVLLRTEVNNQPEEKIQYISNIINSEPPYLKLDKENGMIQTNKF